MSLPGEVAPEVLDQHDHINDNTREDVKAMETGYRKKVIGKVGRRHGSIGIGEGIPTPPGAFAMQVCPFPGLTAKKGQTAEDRQDHIEGYFLPIAAMPRGYGQDHCHRAHNENEGHQAHEYQRQIDACQSRESPERFVGVGPAIACKTDRSIRDQKSAKGKAIAHQEIPHHKLTVLHIEGAFSATPPFLSCWYRLCHIRILLFY